MSPPKHTISQVRITPGTFLIGLAIFFVCLTPFAKSIPFGLGFMIGLMMMISLFSGAFVLDALRADSPTLLTFDGTRKSRGSVESFFVTGNDEHLPGMSWVGYGGVRYFSVAAADNSALVAPSECLEKLNDTVLLAYTSAVPLKKAEAVSGLFGGETDILLKSQDSSFTLKKGKSEVRFSLLNTLIEIPTTSSTQKQQLYIDRYAMSMANKRKRVTLDEESNIAELRKLSASIRKQPWQAQLKKWIAGNDEDRPSTANNPYGGEQ